LYILTSRIEWTRRLAIVEEIGVWLGAWILVWTQIRVWIWLRVQVGCRHGLGLGFGSDPDPWGFLCNSRESSMDLKYTHVFLTVSYSISSKYMIDWLIDCSICEIIVGNQDAVVTLIGHQNLSRCGVDRHASRVLWLKGWFFIGTVGLAIRIRSSYIPNLKSLGAPVTDLSMAVQNAENGVFGGGSGHWSS